MEQFKPNTPDPAELARRLAVFPEIPAEGGDAEKVLAAFAQAGIDDAALAIQLQIEGNASLTKSWNDLMAIIESKSTMLAKGESSGGAR
jgi:transaldolase